MNKTGKSIARIAISALAISAAGSALAHSDDEPGVWLGITAKGAIDTNKVFTVNVHGEDRFSEKHLTEQHGSVALDIKLTDWFTLSPRIHSVYSRNDSINGRKKANGNGYVDHGWDRELRIGADGTFSQTFGGWKFSDRNRIVWRDYEDDHGFWRYRNRIQVNSPWKWTDYKINPYTSFELFLDDGKPAKDVRKNDKFDQWRFVVGFQTAITKRISLNTYYLLQEKKDTSGHDWSGHNIIGLDLAFKF